MMVSGIEINIVKKKIKNMNLTVSLVDGKVRLSVPYYAKDEDIKQFVVSKIGWVKKQIEKIDKLKWVDYEYVCGESHYLWGRSYLLEIRYSGKASGVEVKDNRLVLTVRINSTRQQREKVMNEWYRAELKAKLPETVERWAEFIGVTVNSVNVKNMRTRWGTCNIREKRIWINLQLAKKSTDCLEYIVVHELVHLLEKNHSAVFYQYLDKYFPKWRSIKKELNCSMR